MMDLNKKFALTIAGLRLNSSEKITQQEVADYVGINVRHYYNLEKGLKTPSLKILQGIADCYNMKLSELCALIEEYE